MAISVKRSKPRIARGGGGATRNNTSFSLPLPHTKSRRGGRGAAFRSSNTHSRPWRTAISHDVIRPSSVRWPSSTSDERQRLVPQLRDQFRFGRGTPVASFSPLAWTAALTRTAASTYPAPPLEGSMDAEYRGLYLRRSALSAVSVLQSRRSRRGDGYSKWKMSSPPQCCLKYSATKRRWQ